MRSINTNIFKYAGLTAVFIEYSAIFFFVFIAKEPLNLSRTISDIGALDATHLVFSISIMSAAILFYLFSIWLSRTLRLHSNFLKAASIGALAQSLFSWIPVTGDLGWLHFLFAIVVMITMPVMIYYYSKATKNKTMHLFSRGIVGIQIFALILLPFASFWNIPLLAEIITSIGFQTWAIAATFDK